MPSLEADVSLALEGRQDFHRQRWRDQTLPKEETTGLKACPGDQYSARNANNIISLFLQVLPLQQLIGITSSAY